MSDCLYKTWRAFLAFFRLDLSAVCEVSDGMGMFDLHDERDSDWNWQLCPYPQVCRRCGKKFWA